ncbi:hypothetical protein BAUCODRAFT_37090 [Baudoinia panamericana UAMH 10762]|uniref:Mitochondrial carrier n=1 Tax=Baudoinia panamericana (strain UAMH 10762) TaxID=717646 RepID=M2N3W6_BAUPA|nr:uncharacterized protein BAUCODRAFT_37090 [Baudoinia panamericana UAMH 10762]EMC93405.1 hypothetical protein BAUCODRAFT_37090 [Baudoinia panamericana UAMH 10762]
MDTQPAAFGNDATLTDSAPATVTNATKSHTNEALHDIAFGSIAGLVGKIVEYPFDTVKVRLQSQPDHLPLRYSGPLDCFKQSIRQDGFRGLYRGVSAPLAGAAAETACLFWSYSLAKDLLQTTSLFKRTTSGGEDLPLAGLITAGAMSGGITSFLLTPIELVKCRMQVPLQSPVDPTLHAGIPLSSKSLSPFAVIRDVFRREGISGFWRGQLGTFLRETGGTAAWFGGWEASSLYLKSRIAQRTSTAVADVQLPLSQQMLAGAIAGMAYNFLFYPADTIKSKIQTGELSQHGARQTFLSVGKALWRTHGFRGLYRGCGITVARSAPSSALIFTIVERLKQAFG